MRKKCYFLEGLARATFGSLKQTNKKRLVCNGRQLSQGDSVLSRVTLLSIICDKEKSPGYCLNPVLLADVRPWKLLHLPIKLGYLG